MLTITGLIAERLRNQRIGGEKCASPADVVRWMGAIQAQDYTQAVWAVGVRTRSCTLVDVEQAIASGQILRTWPMRGTLHFVTAEDARWMIRLNGARTLAAARTRHAQLGLNPASLARAGQVFFDALQGGRRLTRPHMLDLLEHAGISTAGQRGYHLLAAAALSGLICIGPMQDRQQTFALLDEWAPGGRELPRADGLAELARRYFRSHGPASLRDFARWSGLPLVDARSGLEAVRGGLLAETLDGQEYFYPAAEGQSPVRLDGSVDLLPGFDEYLIGYGDRSAVLPSQYAPKIVPGGNGVFKPVLVTGGEVAGTWKAKVKKTTVEIQLEPFGPSAIAREGVSAACARYSQFLGLAWAGVV